MPRCFKGYVVASLVCFELLALPTVWDTFGNGKAEVSSYQVTQPRYGEKRSGYSVLVFVTEDLHAKTRIKVEDYDKTPEKDRVPVLKLNHSLRFSTGIYDYAVMTSVFAGIRDELAPLKLSLSVSEWCGNFYQQLLPEKKGAQESLHSYFEGEGDRAGFFTAPADGIYEDALPILIRELSGTWVKEGEEKSLSLYPSLWSLRQSHRKGEWARAVITKKTDGKNWRWDWKVGERKSTYWVAKEHPSYILRWEESDGGRGERKKTLHLPYWEKNGNADLKLRKELGIP